MNSRQDCTGVVLAGGMSCRMAERKAELVILGQPLLTRVVARLSSVCTAVVVVGPPDLQALAPGALVVADRRPGEGPLGGLATALQRIETSHACVVACDMPFIQPKLLSAMIDLALERPDAEVIALQAVPGRFEYLHSIYSRACLPAAMSLLATNRRSLRALFELLAVYPVPDAIRRQFDRQGVSAFNANTPADWARALAVSERESGSDADNHTGD